MYMLNMVIILIVMYCNVVTAIDKIPMYLLRFNKESAHGVARVSGDVSAQGSAGGAFGGLPGLFGASSVACSGVCLV